MPTLERSAVSIAAPAAEGGASGGRLLPLQTQGLTLEVGDKRLIDGIDLSLAPGWLTVVMGPNGAGKTLLLHLLHGLREPTSGQILWGGVPMSADVRRRQAMVFQHAVLLRRSVAANVDFALSVKGCKDRSRRDWLLERFGLLDRARQPARLLSGGERQRLALARALAAEPEVLFLDEPAANLDPASTLMIEQAVLDVRRQGIKVIFVTHDLGQARRVADEVVFIHHGRLVEHQSAGEFFINPASEAARAYLDGRIVF